MSYLVLINGAPGVGKSTVASLLAAHHPMALALDIDSIKHALGGWERDPYASGVQARKLALAMAHQHLADGYDVVIGQYLARTEFIEELGHLAATTQATFVETLLTLAPDLLAERIARRQRNPDRPEHAINNALVQPKDAAVFTADLDRIIAQRPNTIRIPAQGDPEDVAIRIEALRAQID